MSRPERYFKILTCWINLIKEKLEYLLHQPQRPPFPVSPIPKRQWIHKNWDPTPKLIFGGSMRVQNNNNIDDDLIGVGIGSMIGSIFASVVFSGWEMINWYNVYAIYKDFKMKQN